MKINVFQRKLISGQRCGCSRGATFAKGELLLQPQRPSCTKYLNPIGKTGVDKFKVRTIHWCRMFAEIELYRWCRAYDGVVIPLESYQAAPERMSFSNNCHCDGESLCSGTLKCKNAWCNAEIMMEDRFALERWNAKHSNAWWNVGIPGKVRKWRVCEEMTHVVTGDPFLSQNSHAPERQNAEMHAGLQKYKEIKWK